MSILCPSITSACAWQRAHYIKLIFNFHCSVQNVLQADRHSFGKKSAQGNCFSCELALHYISPSWPLLHLYRYRHILTTQIQLMLQRCPAFWKCPPQLFKGAVPGCLCLLTNLAVVHHFHWFKMSPAMLLMWRERLFDEGMVCIAFFSLISIVPAISAAAVKIKFSTMVSATYHIGCFRPLLINSVHFPCISLTGQKSFQFSLKKILWFCFQMSMFRFLNVKVSKSYEIVLLHILHSVAE